MIEKEEAPEKEVTELTASEESTIAVKEEDGNQEKTEVDKVKGIDQPEKTNSADNEVVSKEKEEKSLGEIESKSLPSAYIEESVDKIVDQFENITVFGNKSLNELQSIQSKRSHLYAGIFFTDPSLRIPQPILDSLTKEMRFEKPSEIQASTLPLILSNKSVIAQAQSGAGKTIAFVIGMLAKVDTRYPTLQALCLAPARELANQIVEFAVKPLSSRLPHVTYLKAIPGFEVDPSFISTNHIIVGTPGTVKNWAERKWLRMETVKVFVLDEADKMVDEKSLGADTLRIKKMLHPEAQVLFFSATYSKEVLDYARMIIPRAYVVKPKSTEELVLDVIFQVRVNVTLCPGGKLKVLQEIYELLTIQQSIVFVEMKRDADKVAKMMIDAGFMVSSLHGELLPIERDRVMEDFRSGQSKVLITTNALARGVDVPAVAVVVNYDLPVKRVNARKVTYDAETYLHRIGRCGRFGRRGTAVNFLENPLDFQILEDIERVYSPEKRMTTEWDPNDIAGLRIAIEERPEGGEILPTALTSSGQPSTVSITLLT
eukprot:CAMPEP_0170059962 /NCGR_PEP_ID=MMETSP0019_2-20121128/2055_1 /TAXON_ID=98059 /ORGANISM="Dinobryon sp., Strain UTEXLB2267" /LENGTH=543 /DNA_ID=CAMNT_0010265367 /DNA_START=35 /DNA_END=1666 /DNA_ORIENTATION=-